MARNGSGVYSLPQAPFVSGTTISSTAVNSDFSDVATALTQSIASDGQTAITANLPMTGYAHTNVANSTARNMYAATGQVQDSAFIWCGTAGGTADALTLTPTPAITAYAAGQVFRFTAGASPNTGAATVAVSGLTAQAIQSGGSALAAGAIAAGRQYEILYDGTQFQVQAYAGASITAGRGIAVSGSAVSISGVIENVATAATLNLASFNGTTINLTGSTNISAISNGENVAEITAYIGDGTPTLVHNTSALTIQGAANYTASIGDKLRIKPTGNTTGTIFIERGNGTAVVASGGSGALELIGDSGNISNQASVVFNVALANYSAVKIIGRGVVPATDNVSIYIEPRVSGTYIGNGATEVMGLKAGALSCVSTSGFILNKDGYSNNSTALAANSFEGTIFAKGPGKTRVMGVAHGFHFDPTTNWELFHTGYVSAANSSAIDSIAVKAGSGNISGQFTCYGVKIT